jgi:hypothetical protein
MIPLDILPCCVSVIGRVMGRQTARVATVLLAYVERARGWSLPLGMAIGIAAWFDPTAASAQELADPTPAAAAIAERDQAQFFEAKIRPLLLDHCLPCHSDQEADGGLSLESRAGWWEREVIVPGRPSESRLLDRVNSDLDAERMPPVDSQQAALSEAQVQALKLWIERGAYDPRTTTDLPSGPRRRNRPFQITPRDREHWAFQPLSTRAQQRLAMGAPAWQVIDQHLQEVWQRHDLREIPLASPRELVRRVTFDLWGLPPDPAMVAAFEQNPSDAAWAELIERLLESPYYGQRWGRHWLDVVRFAETNGYERDGRKPNAWRYRDYVIAAFNQDKPYHRFIWEQLAGDHLIEAEGLTLQETPQAWREAVIATGFARLHVWDDEPDSSFAAEYDDLDDVLNTTATAFLGLTIACARCHDHKFDPISQTDYYAWLDFYRDIDPYGLPKHGGGGRGTGRIERYLCDADDLARWQEQREAQIAALTEKLTQHPQAEERPHWEQAREQWRAAEPPFEKALAIQPPAQRPATHVLKRGDPQSLGGPVRAAVPGLFGELGVPGLAGPAGSGETAPATRLDLARWLTEPDHPLTARVMVNRIWQQHFGSGIVPTPDDFGYTGIPPVDPELLDLLAAVLLDANWSIKSLQRAILRTHAYRRSSDRDRLAARHNANRDPDNRYFSRQNLRRLDAESLRDALLVQAGALHPKEAGPSIYPTLRPEIRATANPVSVDDWRESPADEQMCRSVFLVVKRSLKDPLLEAFDFANSHAPVGARNSTTVAPQALMLLNDPLVRQLAERLADQLLTDHADRDQRLVLLWQRVWQRTPRADEVELAQRFVAQTTDQLTEREAWVRLVRVLWNSNESLYVD